MSHCYTCSAPPDLPPPLSGGLQFVLWIIRVLLARALDRFRDACNDTATRVRPGLQFLYKGERVADRCLRIEITALETMNFEQWLIDKEFPVEVIEWCDAYCPTDGSAYPRDMSALAGLLLGTPARYRE